jgi:hypothetical protein
MDPITSAWVYVVTVAIFTTLSITSAAKSLAVSLVAIISISLATVQLGYYADLWPLYLLSGYIISLLVVLSGASIVQAVRDSHVED